MNVRFNVGIHPTVALVRALRAAAWFEAKAREQARVSGYHRAALNLRKQGVPLEIARTLLLGK